MKLIMMNEVINGLRYQTENSTLLASDAYWDGQNFERQGRNKFLLKTLNGRYFLQKQTLYQGEGDLIEPISEIEAIDWFQKLRKKEMDFSEAFLDVEIEDA